ncbi:MAG: hypothetical protein QW051_00045 [Candidatus Aenigmatarchaeota archaeon]
MVIKDASSAEGIEKEDFKKAIKENDIILILLPHEKYSEKINLISEVLMKEKNNVCYLTTNKPYKTILKTLEKIKIDTKNLIFIDCVTKSASGFENDGKVICVTSPKALTEMSIALKKTIESKKPEIVLFDSLSTLLIYEDSSVVTRFVHSTISLFRDTNIKGAFIALKEDMKSELVKDLSMFVDKVMEMN